MIDIINQTVVIVLLFATVAGMGLLIRAEAARDQRLYRPHWSRIATLVDGVLDEGGLRRQAVFRCAYNGRPVVAVAAPGYFGDSWGRSRRTALYRVEMVTKPGMEAWFITLMEPDPPVWTLKASDALTQRFLDAGVPELLEQSQRYLSQRFIRGRLPSSPHRPYHRVRVDPRIVFDNQHGRLLLEDGSGIIPTPRQFARQLELLDRIADIQDRRNR